MQAKPNNQGEQHVSHRHSHHDSNCTTKATRQGIAPSRPVWSCNGAGRRHSVASPRGEAKIAPPLRSLVVPIESVTRHPNNPRRGDVDAVAASLARFGQQKPIVVQAGTRYRAPAMW